MIMIMPVKSLVGISFVASFHPPSAGSAVRLDDLGPLPANRRLSSIEHHYKHEHVRVDI